MGIGRESLSRMRGRVIGGEWNIKRGVSQGRAKHIGTKVIDWSVD